MKKTATLLLFSFALVFANVAWAQPGKPTLVLPLNNSVKVSVSTDLAWSTSSSVDSFEIQMATDTSFANPTLDTLISSTSVFTPTAGSLNNFVTYYWRVRGKDMNGFGMWSDTFNFRTIDRISPAPILRTPDNNNKTSPRLPDFDWDDVVRASRYQMQLSTSASFSTLKIDTIFGTGNTEFTYVKDTLSTDSVYFWHVRSENENGWGDWSTASSFEVSFLPPSIPVLLSPANNATNQPLNQRLDWGTSAQTTKYRLYLDTNADLNDPTIYFRDSSLLISHFDLPVENLLLDSSRTYYWTVAAGNDDDFYSRNSDTFSFTTINLLPPNRPTNVSPATASVQHSRQPTFTWSDNSSFLPDSFYLHVSTFFVFTDTALLVRTPNTSHTVPASAPLGSDSVFYWRVAGKNAAGFSPWSFFWNLTTSINSPVKDAFKANMFPNPAISTSTIEFELNKTQNVRVSVVDVLGREVLNIHNGMLEANKHSLPFNVSALNSGNYYIAIAGEGAMQTLPFIKQ